MPLLFRPHTPSQVAYYALRSVAPPELRLFDTPANRFKSDFLRPSALTRDFLPFNYLREGARTVHVGFDRVYLDKGMSHPLLEAAIAKASGTSRAYDPDSRNIDAINAYAEANGITHFKARRAAAWNCRKEIEFMFDGDWGPMSGTLEISEQEEHANSKLESRREKITADCLDEIILEDFPDRRIDFLALSANGAEPEILEGSQKILEANPDLIISLAMAFGHFSFDIRTKLCDELIAKGWTVVISNALHDPWINRPFLWACLYRSQERHPDDAVLEEVTWDRIRQLVTDESRNLARIGDEVRAQVLADRRTPWASIRKRLRRLAGKASGKRVG